LQEHFITFFQKEKIEYYSTITISECEIIKPHLLPENAKSAIVFLIPYYCGMGSEARNLSLYAVSRDYHFYFKELSLRLATFIDGHVPRNSIFPFCDSSPINEVKAAASAGLGVIGRNHLLINERYGSYVFIATVICTFEIGSFGEKLSGVKQCCQCDKCRLTCSFLRGESESCLSMLNQKKTLNDAELATVRAQKLRWGCDTCQEVCPMNQAIETTPISYFHQNRIEQVTPELLEKMSEEEFKQRAFSWRGKNTIIRKSV